MNSSPSAALCRGTGSLPEEPWAKAPCIPSPGEPVAAAWCGMLPLLPPLPPLPLPPPRRAAGTHQHQPGHPAPCPPAPPAGAARERGGPAEEQQPGPPAAKRQRLSAAGAGSRVRRRFSSKSNLHPEEGSGTAQARGQKAVIGEGKLPLAAEGPASGHKQSDLHRNCRSKGGKQKPLRFLMSWKQKQ